MKRNVSVVRFKFCCNILIGGKIIKEMPDSVASGTHCIFVMRLCMYVCMYICMYVCIYLTSVQDKVTVQRLITVSLKGWNSSNTRESQVQTLKINAQLHINI